MKNSKKKLITISILTTLSGVAIYAVNRFISATSVMKNLLQTEESQYYHWQFGKVFYTKKGTGKPLLLIHDLQCSSSSYEWKNLIETLSKEYTVFAIDLLGCGRSDKPQDYLYKLFICAADYRLYQKYHRMSDRCDCQRFIRFLRDYRMQYCSGML